jgi:glucose repression mediator protein
MLKVGICWGMRTWLVKNTTKCMESTIDAYARAAELDLGNGAITQRTQRLHLLKHLQATGAQLPAAPAPQDVHPTVCKCSLYIGRSWTSTSLLHINHSGRPVYWPDFRELGSEVPHHPHISAAETSPAPFQGGPALSTPRLSM